MEQFYKLFGSYKYFNIYFIGAKKIWSLMFTEDK